MKVSFMPRWRWSDANPQGSKGLREQVRLLGKGKLCRAAPKGRERHVTRPRSVGAPRRNGELRKGSCSAACAARTVERGKNPEDGSDEGLATFVFPVGLTAVRASRGTRRKGVSRGARTPREVDPRSLERAGERKRAGPVKGKAGGHDAVEL